jgi:predicted DNA-binding helix-hairpin-helix protein
MAARKCRSLDFDDLKKLGVVLKRAQFFITCKGKSLEKLYMDPEFIKGNLSVDCRAPSASSYTKISMFDMVV